MIIGAESETIEFKLTTGERKEAVESIAAMLNKHSKATVYFGVDDSGFVKGQQISDSTIKDISRTINEMIDPKITPTIETIVIEGKTIIKVTCVGHNRPYSVNGRYFMRVGAENRKMTNEDLKVLINHDDYTSKWEEELTDYTIEDLDDKALMDFYQSAKDCGRLDMPKYEKERMLVSLDLIKDGKVKNGCYALFGSDAKIQLKLATYATDDKVTFTDLKLLSGNIYNLINEAMQYVMNKIDWIPVFESRKRIMNLEIPERAIREIIVNAFAHANYETLPEIEIGVHPGNVEIYNPGSFPENLTPYDFILKNLSSYKRNRLILDVLFRSKDVEKSGTGFQRVAKLCQDADVAWTFRKDPFGFLFEFKRKNQLSQTEENEAKKLEGLILNMIKAESNISSKEIAKRIGKSEKTVQRYIAELIDKKLVEKRGSNRNRSLIYIGE